MNESRRRLCLAPKTLGDFGILGEMRMKDLDDDGPEEVCLLAHIHSGHATGAESSHDPIARARGTSEARQLVIGSLEGGAIEVGKRLLATLASSRRRSIPGAALRTEHRSASELHADEIIRRPRPRDLEP
jgi:hypothetical protein